jgi:hypothetical protein
VWPNSAPDYEYLWRHLSAASVAKAVLPRALIPTHGPPACLHTAIRHCRKTTPRRERCPAHQLSVHTDASIRLRESTHKPPPALATFEPLTAPRNLRAAKRRLELGTKYIKTLDPTADEALVNLSLTFVLLSFFFGPAWGALSGGGEMNPAVLSMKWSMGKTGLLACLLGCVSIVAGYVVGIIGAAAAIEVRVVENCLTTARGVSENTAV